MADSRISAYISEAAKLQVRRYAEAHGVKKGCLVEAALLHHLQALRELPADIVIPPRLTVTICSNDASTQQVTSTSRANSVSTGYQFDVSRVAPAFLMPRNWT
jgi:hypothetical protein